MLLGVVAINVVHTNAKLAYDLKLGQLFHHWLGHVINANDDCVSILSLLEKLLSRVCLACIVAIDLKPLRLHELYLVESIICKTTRSD